ncbi:TPA: DUF3265 domain-containing protein [Vibrio vulnificus]|nr:DUF3265 domain-containing protein [Vibrio vulnificus]
MRLGSFLTVSLYGKLKSTGVLLRRSDITNCLRVIRNAWHFWYAASFGGESGLLKAYLGGTHPLTQR